MSANDALDHGRNGLLSDATLHTLQLHQQPFTTDLEHTEAQDSDDELAVTGPFSDAVTEEQLADIKQALITGDDLLLILGDSGSGKTTLLQQLEANSGLRIQCFPVTGSERFSTINLFSGILEAFQIKPPETLKGVLDELIPCLQGMVSRNSLSVIVLDDAHKASQSELTHLLSGMLYMNSQDETLLRVALSATADFEDLIPDLLPEGADLPYSSLTVEGFSPQRAAAYLDYRLQLAGFDQEFPFTDRDMASLVDHSAGRPADLHTLTADVLNEKYGKDDHGLASHLSAEASGGFLQSRKGKLVLGALATVLILGGALMFMPSQDDDMQSAPREPLVVAEQRQVQPPKPAPEVTVPTPPEPPRVITPEPVVEQTLDEQTSSVLDNASNAIAESIDNASVQADAALTNTPADNVPETSTNSVQTPVAPAEQSTPQSNEEEVEEDPAATTADTSTNAGSATTDAPASDTNQQAGPNETEVADAEPAAQEEQSAANTESEAEVEPAQQTETIAGIGDNEELAGVLESPSWILVQDESLYTIQMSASTDLPSVQNFLITNPLPAPNSIFSFERDGNIWYALVHGAFDTVGDAQRALEQMSDAARRDQPWIRSIARIKGILREE